MSEHLPEFLDPLAFAEKRRRVRGTLPLSTMTRLAASLMKGEGEARLELDFVREGRNIVVAGTVAADLVLQCQCCLQELAWPVHAEVRLAVVRSIDEANRLPEDVEPLMMDGERVALADIVQDELLLAIPTIPQHTQCQPAGVIRAVTPSAEPPKRPNPFGILSELKKPNLQ